MFFNKNVLWKLKLKCDGTFLLLLICPKIFLQLHNKLRHKYQTLLGKVKLIDVITSKEKYQKVSTNKKWVKLKSCSNQLEPKKEKNDCLFCYKRITKFWGCFVYCQDQYRNNKCIVLRILHIFPFFKHFPCKTKWTDTQTDLIKVPLYYSHIIES